MVNLPGSGDPKADIWQQRSFIRKLNTTDLVHVLGDVHYVAPWIKTPQVHTFHDLESLLTGSWLTRRLKRYFWLKLPASKSKAFSCISEHTKSQLLKVLKGRHPSITVIPNPLLLPSLEEEKIPTDFTSQLRQYLSIGTKTNKNLRRVAQALQGRKNYQWHIVGALPEEVENYFHELGLFFQTHNHLSTAELTQLYRDCDVLLFPSLYEGFGLPILEAQANGTVVVTSNVTAMPKTAGGGAILVDPKDVQSITNALDTLEEQPKYVQKLLQIGWHNAQQYTVERIAMEYLAWYKTVLDEA